MWCQTRVSLFVNFSGMPAFAETSPQIDQQAISEDFVHRLVQITTSLRGVGIVDSTKINEFFTRGDSSPYDAHLPDDDADASPILWSYFFRNTQLYYGHVRNGAPIVGYYDPFSDFWLITQWDNSIRDPVLTGAKLVPAEFLGDSEESPSESPLPLWIQDLEEKPLMKALPKRVADAARDFEARYPYAARTPPSLPVLPDAVPWRERFRDRVSWLFSTLLALQADETTSKTYLEALAAVENGDPLSLGKLFAGPTNMPLAEVASFPEVLRQELEPVVYLAMKGGRIILSTRTDNGRWLLVSAFDDEESPNLSGIAYVDLFEGAETR